MFNAQDLLEMAEEVVAGLKAREGVGAVIPELHADGSWTVWAHASEGYGKVKVTIDGDWS
jgi:CRISPR/Cas system CSM-associated protein Csm3 (group 7 of RAMP superfamily)